MTIIKMSPKPIWLVNLSISLMFMFPNTQANSVKPIIRKTSLKSFITFSLSWAKHYFLLWWLTRAIIQYIWVPIAAAGNSSQW